MNRLLLFAAALAIGASLAIAATGLDIRTGLWQMTYRTEIKGAHGPRTMTVKTCVTAKDLQEGAFRADSEDEGEKCQYQMKVRTARLQEAILACDGEVKRSGTLRVEALGREKIQGRITMQGPGVSSDMQLSGQWISASCAGAEDE